VIIYTERWKGRLFETFGKCPISVKIKARDDFNQRNPAAAAIEYVED